MLYGDCKITTYLWPWSLKPRTRKKKQIGAPSWRIIAALVLHYISQGNIVGIMHFGDLS